MNRLTISLRNAVENTLILKASLRNGCCSNVFDLHWTEYKLYVGAVDLVYPAWLEIIHVQAKSALHSFAVAAVDEVGYMIYRIGELLECDVMSTYLPAGDLHHLMDALEEVYNSLLDVLTPDAVPNFYCALLNLS